MKLVCIARYAKYRKGHDVIRAGKRAKCEKEKNHHFAFLAGALRPLRYMVLPANLIFLMYL